MSAERAWWKIPVSRIWYWAFSLPLYIKILGVGVVVTLTFGLTSYYGIRHSLYSTHYQIHAEPVLSVAKHLASTVSREIRAGQLDRLDAEIDLILKNFSDIRYVIVQYPRGKVVGHRFTFPTDIPKDLMAGDPQLCASCHSMSPGEELRSDLLEITPSLNMPDARFQAYKRDGGIILEATVPVFEGEGGSVRVGMGDRIIRKEIASVTRALLVSLVVCLVVGQGLALVLVNILVHPIKSLVQATSRLRSGDFDARATVYSDDEIGELARDFNLMAESLGAYQQEVRRKETARLSLLERIVHAQEEERKSVARELHDQLGQALSSVLLSFQGLCRDHHLPEEQCAQLEGEMRALIDEVRRLAWDIRPSVLDDYGLDSALKRYVEEVARRSGIDFDYHCVQPETDERLPNRVEVTLYRVAQEAITNIIRHSEASQASVVLITREKDVTLIVEDNGKGFDKDELEGRDRESLGLMGMKERVSLIGGELAIESSVDSGTTVQIKLPLTEEEVHVH